MDLFDTGEIKNLLPYDGVVHYHGKLLTQTQALFYFDSLFHSIDWKHDEAVIFGKHIITRRKAAWYGDENYHYTYSNITRQALAWTKDLLCIKHIFEEVAGTAFNSCLLNLYHNGDEGMAWHSDDEKELAKNSPIASLSLGAERNFYFRHKKTKETISVFLENGSLLVMKEGTQTNWLHTLPKAKKVTQPRINLTFRVYGY